MKTKNSTLLSNAWILILLTPFFFYVTHAFAFFIHEYSHSFSAWILGFKNNPLILNFGDTSLSNLLFFSKMDENVNYQPFYAAHPWQASFIAFAGMGIGNVLLFIVSVIALLSKKTHSKFYYYFFLWLAVMNLGNFNDYIPGRTFSSNDDIGYITTTFLNISPWWIMIIFGYPICYCFWFFYSKLLPLAYKKISCNFIQQVIVLVMITFTLFAVFGMAGQSNHGIESHLIALLSLYSMPIVIVACWPKRKWVIEATKAKSNEFQY